MQESDHPYARITKAEKVVMHVNKFVHPVEKIPKAIKKEDIQKWEDGYKLPEQKRIS